MDILLPTHHYFSSLRPDYLLYDSLISQINGTFGLQDLIEYQNSSSNSSSFPPPWVEIDEGERGREDGEKERRRIVEILKEVDEERKKLKEDNFFLLKKILSPELEDQDNIKLIITRLFLVNSEFHKKYNEQQEKNNLLLQMQLDLRNNEILNLKNEIVLLKQKLKQAQTSSSRYRFPSKSQPFSPSKTPLKKFPSSSKKPPYSPSSSKKTPFSPSSISSKRPPNSLLRPSSPSSSLRSVTPKKNTGHGQMKSGNYQIEKRNGNGLVFIKKVSNVKTLTTSISNSSLNHTMNTETSQSTIKNKGFIYMIKPEVAVRGKGGQKGGKGGG